jgi:hypothetical protein
MATLIIEIPENETADISNIVKAKGGTVTRIDSDDDDLTIEELEALKRGLKEALMIKEGRIRSIAFSDLWND